MDTLDANKLLWPSDFRRLEWDSARKCFFFIFYSWTPFVKFMTWPPFEKRTIRSKSGTMSFTHYDTLKIKSFTHKYNYIFNTKKSFFFLKLGLQSYRFTWLKTRKTNNNINFYQQTKRWIFSNKDWMIKTTSNIMECII